MTPRAPNRLFRLAALLATALVVQACTAVSPAQAPTGASPAAPASPASQATAPAPAANPYRGTFVSDCQSLTEGLQFIDRIELTPQGSDVAVQYRKHFFGGSGCKADTLLVTFNLPPSRWTVGEAVALRGKTGHRITTVTDSGQITATPAKPGTIEDKGDTFVLRFGQGGQQQLPVDKKTQGGRTKELRLLDGDNLYVSDQTEANDKDYPASVDFEFPYKRL